MSKLKNIRVLSIAAMLSAIAILLSFFKIPLGNIVEIRFSALPIGLAGYMFGPIVGGIVGGIADIGGYIVSPTGPYAPGFTIDTILTGVIYGLILYKKPISIKRTAVAVIVNAVIINIIMNSFWLSVLYSLPFGATVIARLPKEVITSVIYIIVFDLLMRSLARIPNLKLQTNED